MVAANDDFADVEASVDEVVPDIVFSILSPINGDFVLVLDRSSSMNDNKIGTPRMDRLKQACIEWIQLELQDDSFLGITSFRYGVTSYSTGTCTNIRVKALRLC